MSFTVGGGSKKEYQSAPVGSHAARAYQMIDLGVQKNSFQPDEEPTHQLFVRFELGNELMEDGKPLSEGRWINVSIGDLAKLVELAEAVEGKAIPFEERKHYDFQSVLGKPVQVTVKETSSGKTKIKGFGKLPKGLDCPELVNPITKFSLGDMVGFSDLPDWQKLSIEERLADNIWEYRDKNADVGF